MLYKLYNIAGMYEKSFPLIFQDNYLMVMGA